MLTPTWLLTGSHGLWAADCIVPGCIWTTTASTPEAADAVAVDHAQTCHPDRLDADDTEGERTGGYLAKYLAKATASGGKEGQR
jgi:hypothetical protein